MTPTPPLHPARETILAWMTANQAGPAAAGRHFGIPSNRIKQWLHKARQGVPVAPAHPERPHLTILPPPASDAKIALPMDVEKLAQGAVKLALATMIKELKKGEASISDCAKVIAAVTDRLDVFGGIVRAAAASSEADQLSDAAMELDVMREAAAIAERSGRHDLAAGLRASV